MSPFFDHSRDGLRRGWLDAWRRGRDGLPLTPLEAQLVDVLQGHPEYHAWLEQGERALTAEFTPESGVGNPFLHLSLHLAIEEQLGIDQPPGIRAVVDQLKQRMDRHEALHIVLDCLGEVVWKAQRDQQMPDTEHYLDLLRRAARDVGLGFSVTGIWIYNPKPAHSISSIRDRSLF